MWLPFAFPPGRVSAEVAMRCVRPCLLGAIVLLLACAQFAGAEPPPADFEKAAAVVVKHCLGCHNPGEARGSLDLTRKAGLLQGGKSGPAVVAGKPPDSLLIERVVAG